LHLCHRTSHPEDSHDSYPHRRHHSGAGRFRIAVTILALAVSAGTVFAQSASTKQLKVKSQKEAEAIQAMFQAPDPTARIAAAKELITKFADTDFKSTAFYIMAFSAQQTGELENVVVYAEQALGADDKNYGAMILIGSALAVEGGSEAARQAAQKELASLPPDKSP